MKILVVGSGAREHAILRALDRENAGHKLFSVGDNPGICELAEVAQGISEADGGKIAAFCNAEAIELVIIGPEAPLAAGVADEVISNAPNTKVFAPTKAAAQLEASKSFAKEVMHEAGIPTGGAAVCKNMHELLEALNAADPKFPFVVKADGLAAGKGVIVTDKKSEAQAHASAVFNSGGFVILEEYLDGPEFSQFFICDGFGAVPLLPAQDFKRIFDGDEGPNTGGMGAYTPLDWLPLGTVDWCKENIADPLVKQMAVRGTPFVGVLFVGLAYTSKGPKVIEFNVRFGDPETQVVLEKLQTPLSTVLYAAASGKLGDLPPLKWDDQYYCNIVLASKGYPTTNHKGDRIDGLKQAVAKGAVILHAGTAYTEADIDQIVTNGGRVLSVVGRANTLELARQRAYNYVKMIDFSGMQYRRDIALKAVDGQIKV